MSTPLATAIALLASIIPTTALATPREDLDYRVLHEYVTYTINPDYTHTEIHDIETRVLRERAVEGAKEMSISYSTSVQQAEVLSAFTEKPDGSWIMAPKDNYQVRVNRGAGEGGPVFSGRTTLTVVFPDVAVGDTLSFQYKLTQTEPIFPGEFSVYDAFSREQAYDDVKIVVDAPVQLALARVGRGMTEKSSEHDGRRVTEWTWSNPAPEKGARKDYSVVNPDDNPGYTVSSFATYREIIDAYSARATPKAAATPRVTKLANEIVAGETDRRMQARRLYDWVATNITYAGNCVGVGAVVPHDLDFVLDNRMGDCKDHATLLQALLAAQGIASSQALINAGNIYVLPPVPVVSQVNHVINYLPEFDLFVDSTSRDSPFGALPFADEGKPVLLVGADRDTAHTPPHAAGADSQYTKMVAEIDANGAVTGYVTATLTGSPAISYRGRLRNTTLAEVNEGINEGFKRGDRKGSASMSYEDPQALEATFAYRMDFSMDDFAQVPGPAAFRIATFGGGMMDIGDLLASGVNPIESVPVACQGGTSIADFEFHLPKGVKVLGMPDDVTLNGGNLRYSAKYAAKKGVISVHRELVDSTRGNTCSPEVMSSQRDVSVQALRNLRGQVVYK